MNILSDTESSDSDTGRRFKTASTRKKDLFVSKKDVHDRDEREIDRRRHSRTRSRDRDCTTSRSRYSDRRRTSRERHWDTPRSRDSSRHNRDGKSTSRRNSPDTTRNGRPLNSDEPRDKRRRSDSRERVSIRNGSAVIDHDANRRQRHGDDLAEPRPTTQMEHSVRSNRARSASRERKSDRPNEVAATSTTSGEKAKLKKSKHKKHKHKSRHSREREGSVSQKQKNPRQSVSVDKEHASDVSEVEEVVADAQSNKFEVIDDLMCGPALPPHMLKKRSASPAKDLEVAGPQLPPSWNQQVATTSTSIAPIEKPTIKGPTLPSGIDLSAAADNYLEVSDISESDDSDADVVGPMPIGAEKSKAHLELEKRAIELKLAKLKELGETTEKQPAREEWMLELPEIHGVAGLGLVARQFRAKERDEIGDRTGWTDKPSDRERKAHQREPTADELKAEKQRETDAAFIAARDAQQEEAARKHKEKHKRDESLLDIHQKKLEKKKKKEMKDGKPVRRPFDRDNDLKVNRFDEAQKRSVIKKAQLLDTRFGSGQSKFL